MAVRRKVEVEMPVVPMAPVWEQPKKTVAERMFPAMVVLVVVMAFALGAMWSKIKYLEEGAAKAAAAPTVAAGQQPAQPQVSLKTIKDLFSKNVVKFGDANRKVLFVEGADPSCPYCHVAAGLNGELNKQMGDNFKLVADGGTYVAPLAEMRKLVTAGKAGLVYIYTPGHGNGEMAMKAMYCANEKGRFWEVHDVLMTNAGYNLINNDVKNDKANAGKLVSFLAGQIDSNFLTSCLSSGKYDKRLGEDQQLASGIGIQGTPGFYVNATNFSGAYPWSQMQSAVDAALK
jgi:protein-disulfide isomerase